MLQNIQIMQQLRFNGWVGAHCEGQFPLGLGQASSTLDEFAPQCTDLHEEPQRCRSFGGIALLLIGHHLHFAVEVMRKHGREDIDLIAGLAARRDVIHLGLGLELGENTFLGTAPIVEAHDLPGGKPFVGDDDLEVIAVFAGVKQIQLDRLLVLSAAAGADKNKAIVLIPVFGFPVCLEKLAPLAQVPPAFSPVHQPLEFGNALEQNADGECHPFGVQQTDNLIADEALSMRASIQRGRIVYISCTQARMNAWAPLESCTLPGRCHTSSTWPVWATVQNSG